MNIKIEGRNQNLHNCMDCGEPLTKKEYYSCFDRCVKCKNKHYNGAEYVYRNGANKIDEILVNKFRVKEI